METSGVETVFHVICFCYPPEKKGRVIHFSSILSWKHFHRFSKDTCGRFVLIFGKTNTFQVRCMILDAWGWCTGTTQRDGMVREEGGGFRMGNTCIPVADSF